MGAKSSRLIVLVLNLLALGLLATSAYADDPTVRIPGGCPTGKVSVPAGGSLTLVSGWAMATRGNTQAFANAATGVMTIDGQPVTAVQSDVFPLPVDFEPFDAWRVQWSYTTTGLAVGQSIVVTFTIVLAHQVADHELGRGKPIILPAGQLFPPITCTVTGI
ncbi:MAG TPA: hypothetical protein VHK65_02880 [Candidatus Dormibacteraeota bacterium]|nr:hypothetical protein [Candidatus Dormibacteraeota bacterium]